MSRAIATPPAGRPAAPAAAAPPGMPPQRATTTAATVAGAPATVPTPSRASGWMRTSLEGTPGRMRLLGFVAAFAAAVFGIVGASALWSSAGALERADHNTAQVVRIQGIYADLVRADADATSAFLVGGLEDSAHRADYDAALARVATGITAAAQAQPADSEALGVLNAKVQSYAATVEQARVYNRQGLPVGAQYLNNASASLRSDALPIVDALRKANTDRANTEFAASSSSPALFLVGILALAALVLVMVWLAQRTHRYLNGSMFVGSLLVLAALALGAITLGGVGSQVKVVQNSDFADTVAIASARTAAFDAKSNESLTLIARGSGGTYEDLWKSQSASVLTELAGLSGPPMQSLKGEWNAYADQHNAIRDLDNSGQWDAAVAAAVKAGPGTANEAFSTFDTDSGKALTQFSAQLSAALTAPVAWVTVLGWLLLALCVAAALLVLRGIGQRVEEYR